MVVSHKAPVMSQRPAKTITRSSALCALLLTAASCQGVAPETASADVQGALVGPRQCAIPLPDGPPAKPDRMTAFGATAAWDVGRTVGRNAITSAGSMVGGPIGGAVAGGIAARALPSGFDIRGRWTVTDGASGCGCSVSFTAPGSWTGANAPRGAATASGCNNDQLAGVADWRLDETMTGIDAELLLYAQNGNRIAVLKRNGADHYTGQLSTGQQLTLWRE